MAFPSGKTQVMTHVLRFAQVVAAVGGLASSPATYGRDGVALPKLIPGGADKNFDLSGVRTGAVCMDAIRQLKKAGGKFNFNPPRPNRYGSSSSFNGMQYTFSVTKNNRRCYL